MCPESQLERWITAGKGLEPETWRRQREGRSHQEATMRSERERDPRMGLARAASGWAWLEMGQGESSQSPGDAWWAEARWPATK